jgi:hypothetical protein
MSNYKCIHSGEFMKMLARRSIAFLLALTGNAALAALSSVTHPAFGPASLTLDSEQGLYWLTPNATTGLSFIEVSALLANDARFVGFRVASLSELASLYSQAGIPDINVPGYGALYGTSENVLGVEYLQSLIGITYSIQQGASQNLAETIAFIGGAFTSPVNGFLSVGIGTVALRPNVATDAGPLSFASAYTTWGALPVGTNAVGVGTWLVSSVPDIPTWASLCLGFGVLTAGRARTRANP